VSTRSRTRSRNERNYRTEDRRDYIQNFVPFVATLFNQRKYKKVKISTLRRDFADYFGLLIPYHPMLAILERANKAGYITKHANGTFVPVMDKVQEADFSDVASDKERQFENVIQEFIKFCAIEYNEAVSQGDAERALMAFLKDHDLDLLFMKENAKSLLPSVEATISQKYLMNRFVSHAHEADPTIFQSILEYSIGHIFANALTFYDDSLTPESDDLSGCRVYLDIGFLFNITGTNGEERKDAYTEFLKALRQKGADLYVFRHTCDEFRGVIEGSLYWIDNKYYDPGRASRATEYFVENGYSSSDIEQFIRTYARQRI
jgi:hypothetical protein